MTDVFISYPREAQDDAALLAKALRALGVSAWYSPKDLADTSKWPSSVLTALNEANAVVFLIVPDPQAASSRWMQEGYMAALESYWKGNKKHLVPILVGNAQPPYFLAQWKSLKVQKKSDWSRVADELAHQLKTQAPVHSEPSKKAKEEWKQRLHSIVKSARRLEGSLSDQEANVAGRKGIGVAGKTQKKAASKR